MAVSDKKKQKTIAELQPILLEGEQVLAAATGMAHVTRMGVDTARNGTLFLTDRRVGVFTKKLGGHDLTDFAYGLLTSVEHKKGMLTGEVTIVAAGASMQVRMIDKSEIDEVVTTMRDRMAASHNQGEPVPSATPSSPVSAADEIAKLVALRDSGALTEEEFQAHKANLL